MAFIRSGRNAIDKMAPGELPRDLEVADETYMAPVNIKTEIIEGRAEFLDETEKQVDELFGKKPESSSSSQQAPQDAEPTAGEYPSEAGQKHHSNIDVDWLTETKKIINWNDSVCHSWIKANLKVEPSKTLLETCNNMSADNLQKFTKKLQELRAAAGK